MRRTVPKGLISLLAITLSGCGAGGHGYVDSTPRGEAAPKVHLVEISPALGSVVDSSTVIEATVEYHVPDPQRHPGPYTVDISFEDHLPGLRGGLRPFTPEERRNASGPETPGRQISSDPNGRMSFKYPMSMVWGLENLARPVGVHFVLMSVEPPAPNDPNVSGAVRRIGGRMLAYIAIEYPVADTIGSADR